MWVYSTFFNPHHPHDKLFLLYFLRQKATYTTRTNHYELFLLDFSRQKTTYTKLTKFLLSPHFIFAPFFKAKNDVYYAHGTAINFCIAVAKAVSALTTTINNCLAVATPVAALTTMKICSDCRSLLSDLVSWLAGWSIGWLVGWVTWFTWLAWFALLASSTWLA